jgi:hypothetical protein
MHLKTLLAAAALLLAAAGPASPTSEFSPDAFRAHVEFLGADGLEGREAGTRGYDAAADYVAAQFASLGLRPAAGGGWFQPVEFIRYRPGGTPRLTVAGRTYSHGREILLRASPDPQPLVLDAPLVFVGYGLDLPRRGFDDYSGLDVRGKIVVALNGTPIGTPSDVSAHLNAEKARMAAARGAVGMLVIRNRTEAASMSWERMVSRADRPGTTWLDREGRPFVAHPLVLNAYIDQPVAVALFAGARRSLDQVLLDASRHGVRPRGFVLPHAARFERDGALVTRFASPNVVAMLPGTDPALANEHVLLMAHLDGLGISESGANESHGGDRIRNGAMDNAAGVATLIEVARQMARAGNRPRRPVLFAAVTAEEKGLLGAEYLARNPVVDGRVVSVVNLDMPLLTYDFQDVTAFGAEHSTLGPIVARAAARMNVALSPDPLPQEGLFTRSDHYKFVREGVPSVFLVTGFANGGRERFTRFLADHYHGPTDDLSLPFDWNAGARFARLNYLIAREIADGELAPRWYAGSFFGDLFGGSQRRARRPTHEAASR